MLTLWTITIHYIDEELIIKLLLYLKNTAKGEKNAISAQTWDIRLRMYACRPLHWEREPAPYAIDDDQVREVMKLPENEDPLYIMPVGKLKE